VKIPSRIAVLAVVSLCAAAGLGAARAGIWIDVPYVAQSQDGCGSAVISMVMRYWAEQPGHGASPGPPPEKIQRLLFSRAEKGIPASSMRRYFERSGYRTFAFRGDWSDLRRHLSQGRPLIVSLKASGSHGPDHYAVVVGLDWERGYVFLNDPARAKMLRISRQGFQWEWGLANNWTLLAVPAAGN
jgi:ABC-type bacteriocin/lantibiotic exporter with double-glycine peptidase domain